MTSNNFLQHSNLSIRSSFNQPGTLRNFFNREEYVMLKSQGGVLDQKIKLRKEFENKYHSIKLNEVEKEIEQIKFKNQIANKRNEDLLSSLQKDMYKCYQVSKVACHSKQLLDKDKKKYADYMSYQLSNMRNEFQLKLLAKQNELHGIKSMLENQLNHNEEVLRMENDYSLKMAKMNQELADKIRILHEKNKKIDQERKDMMQSHSKIEEKTRDAFFKILNEKEKENEILNEKLNQKVNEKLNNLEQSNLELILKKFKESELNKESGTKNFFLHNIEKNNITQNSTQEIVKTIKNAELNKSILKTEENIQKGNDRENINLVKQQSENLNNSVNKKTKKYSHKPGILDQIRNKRKDKSSRGSSPKFIDKSIDQISNIPKNNTSFYNIKSNKSRSKEREPIMNIPDKEDKIIINDEFEKKDVREHTTLQIKQEINFKNKDMNIDDNKNDTEDKKNFDKKLSENEFEQILENKDELKINTKNLGNKIIETQGNIINTNENNKNDNKKEISNLPSDSQNVNNEITNLKINNQENISGKVKPDGEKIKDTTTVTAPPKKKSKIEILLEEKPELVKVRKDFKIQVLKKVISQIEKEAKNVKPNSPSSYVYQTKHMNFSNNKMTKIKFYEILSMLNDTNDSTKDISNINTETLISLSFEIVYTNSKINIHPENLMGKDFNEQLLMNDLDENIREIFELLSEHMKKIVLDRKTSPHVAANLLANAVINFDKDPRMMSNLVAVLERKLSQKSKLPQNSTSWAAGFNSNNS